MIIEICDLCYQDGEEKKATAKYVDVEFNTWCVCKKHLALVKQAGNLEWWMMEDGQR